MATARLRVTVNQDYFASCTLTGQNAAQPRWQSHALEWQCDIFCVKSGEGNKRAWVPRSRFLRRLTVLRYDRLLPGAYLYTIARTKYIDAILRRELEDGTCQIVSLSAGFHSRAYWLRGQLCAFQITILVIKEF